MRGALFEEQVDPPADLDWMLQSGQVDRLLLAETLVSKHFLPVYRLALSLLNDERLAERAAHATFASALAKARTYPRGIGTKAWLFRLALDSCQAARRRNSFRATLRSLLFFPHRLYRFGTSIPHSDSDVAIWAAADRMKDPLRLVTLLYYVHGWVLADIACLLGWSENEVRRYLVMAHGRFTEALLEVGVPSGGLEEDGLDARLHQSLEARYPVPVFSAELNRIAAGLAEEEVEQAPHRRRAIAFSEVAWMTCIAILAIVLVWGGNILMAGPTTTPAVSDRELNTVTNTATLGSEARVIQLADNSRSTQPSQISLSYYYSPRPGDTLQDAAVKTGVTVNTLAIYNNLPAQADLEASGSLMVPQLPVPQALITLASVSTTGVELPALNPGSSSEQVNERILVSEHLWHTLWADAIVFNNYTNINPPPVTRLQLWVRQPDQSLELAGPVEGEPQYISYGLGDLLFSRQLFCGPVGWCNSPSPGLIKDIRFLLENSRMQDLLLPGRSSWIKVTSRFQVIEEEVTAGRQALIVDRFSSAGSREHRLWVDEQTGVVLRLKDFTGNIYQAYEIVITKIAFDVNFPDGLLDPRQEWQDGFALDHNAWYEIPAKSKKVACGFRERC